MREHFSGFYPKNQVDISKIWAESIFVLDANVLLNMYRYSESVKENLLQVLSTISERLWIPHQAALEYQQNRLTVISEQLKKFSDVKKIINDMENGVQNSFQQLQLKKRHSSINPDLFLEKIRTVTQEFRDDLGVLEEKQLKVNAHDPIRERLDSILDKKIGLPPHDQKELDNIYKEGEIRYSHGIPPGYKDVKKTESYSYQGLVFLRKYGDLILWNQLIQHASQDDIKHVIFITDDQKEDWWWIINSQGPKTIGPRPELVHEIISKSNIQSFLIYNSEGFLKFAKEHLDLDIDTETIEQVRNIAELNRANSDNLQIANDYESDEDIGYLDLIETSEESFDNVTSTLNRMAVHIQQMGDKTRIHTAALDKLTASKGKLSAKNAKIIINSTADDMENFNNQMEIEIPYFADGFLKAINSLTLAATLIEESSREENLNQVFPALESLSDAITQAENPVAELRHVINGLPRLTKNFNITKRRTVSVIERLLSELATAKSLIEDSLQHLIDLLDEDSKN